MFNPFATTQAKGGATAGNEVAPKGMPGAGVQQGGAATVPGSGGMPNNQPNPGAGTGVDTASGGTGVDTTGGAEASPLDEFGDLFTIDPKAEVEKDPLAEKLFNLDPKKLAAAAQKLDFTKVVDKEAIQKALQGDVDSFNGVLNQVMQHGFMTSMQAITQMMEQGITRNNERFSSTLEGRFKDFQINSGSAKNPALNHPAAKPLLAALRQQIARNPKFKGKSAGEIQSMAEKYFLSMHKAIAGFDEEGNPIDPADTDTTQGGGKQQDWSDFLDGKG